MGLRLGLRLGLGKSLFPVGWAKDQRLPAGPIATAYTLHCLLPLQVVGIVLVLMTCRLQTMLGTCRCTLLVPGEVPRTVGRADVSPQTKTKELRLKEST